MTEIRTVTSAGCVVFTGGEENVRVAITARDDHKIWCLPKGHVEEGETIEEAAKRETQEETGLVTEIVSTLPTIDYWFYWSPDDIKYHKYVHYFLAQYLSGSTDDHDHEVDEARFVSPEEAMKMLSYESERSVVSEAIVVISGLGRSNGTRT